MPRRRERSNKSTAGAGCITLFGLPFLLAGTGVCGLGLWQVWQWTRTANWVATPATIQTLELESHHGDDSTTYKVVCTYSYEWYDQTYESQRVGFWGSADNFGSWHERTYERLKKAHDAGELVTCYVNPGDPGEALLDREVRYPVLAVTTPFGLVFASVGGALSIGGLVSVRHERRRQARALLHPDEPWLWHVPWTLGVIKPDLGRKTLWLWSFALVINLISLPVYILMLREVFWRGNFWALLSLIHLAVGLGLLLMAIVSTRQHMRFGNSALRLDTMPGVIGGRLRGELVIVGELMAMDGIDVTLKCEQTSTQRSGGNTSTSTSTVYSDKAHFDAVATRFGQVETRLPIDFEIPYRCRPAELGDLTAKVEWKLEVRAAIPGADLHLDFNVPVFKTDASDAALGAAERASGEADESPDVITNAPPDLDASPPSRQVRIERSVNGHPSFYVSAWMGAGAFVFLSVFVAAFGGVAVFMLVQSLKGDWGAVPFGCCFGLVASLMAAWILSTIGWFRTEILPNEVVRRRRYLWGTFKKRIARERILSVSFRESSSSGSTKFYTVFIEYRRHDSPEEEARHDKLFWKRQTLAVAGNLKGREAATWLAHRLSRALDLGDTLVHERKRRRDDDEE